MDVIVIGAGPTGLTSGAALARRGHRVVVIDRDPGPGPDGTWRRRGAMQFAHPHTFRPQVRELLQAEWPEAWQRWLDLGAEPVEMPLPGGHAQGLGVCSRRVTYERALRRAAADAHGLRVATGSVTRLVERAGRVVGVVVGGATIDADLVVDAGGRRSALAGPTGLHGDTGMAYVTRTYRRHRGAAPGPLTRPAAWAGSFEGYLVLVFPHERGHFSTVIVRPTADAGLGVLRHVEAFDAACRAIPGLADWTDPRVATPTSGVVLGLRLVNLYRPQLGRPGLVALGDSVATTAPTAGRGLALASRQVGGLLDLLDTGADPVTIAGPFGAWCDRWVRPWVQDHLAVDAESVQRWQGAGIDLSRPLTSAAIVATAEQDPRVAPHLAGFLAMSELPSSLAPAEPLARAVYEAGWRPPLGDGPTRHQLVDIARAALTDRDVA